METRSCVLCLWLRNTWLLILLGLLLLGALWLFRDLARFLFWLYLSVLVLAGLLLFARLAQRMWAKLCRKLGADSKGTGSRGHPKPRPVRVPATIYKRPDPMIYSQGWLLARGLGVTWDNPDIKLFELSGGSQLPAQAHALAPGTPHLIRAQIWNGSFDAPAVNLRVRFYYLDFGAGALRTYIGETFVDVAVKGSADAPALAEVPWQTPSIAGHYCVQVELVWPDDADPGNNLGQTNLDVKPLNSPNATFTFLLRNDGAQTARLRLLADSYRLPQREVCTRERLPRELRARQLAEHARTAWALPESWKLDYQSDIDTPWRPGEERMVKVKVTAPDDFVGSFDINLNAFDEGRLVGGVTLRVHS